MATIRLADRADEVRFEICGNFCGGCVADLAALWSNRLADSHHRRVTVDLSQMTGYDAEGQHLLRKMHRHGTSFAGSTTEALRFLREISHSRVPQGTEGPATPRTLKAAGGGVGV